MLSAGVGYTAAGGGSQHAQVLDMLFSSLPSTVLLTRFSTEKTTPTTFENGTQREREGDRNRRELNVYGNRWLTYS